MPLAPPGSAKKYSTLSIRLKVGGGLRTINHQSASVIKLLWNQIIQGHTDFGSPSWQPQHTPYTSLDSCPPVICWLGCDRALDFSHSELLPVGTQLSPYYAVRLTGFFNIHVMITKLEPYEKSQLYIFEKNKVMFRIDLNTLVVVRGVPDKNNNKS